MRRTFRDIKKEKETAAKIEAIPYEMIPMTAEDIARILASKKEEV